MITYRKIHGFAAVLLLAICIAAAQTAHCQEPKLVKKQVAVIQMMDEFRESGLASSLMEAGVKPIDEERFLWTTAKLMSSHCQDCIASWPSQKTIHEALLSVRRFRVRAETISADKEIIRYYERLEATFLLLQKVLDEVNDNAFQAARKHREEHNAFSRLENSLKTGVSAAGTVTATTGDPVLGAAGGAFSMSWNYFKDDFLTRQRMMDNLNEANRQIFRNSREAFRTVISDLEILEQKLDQKFHCEHYVGASDRARDRRKAWQTQDFIMLLTTQWVDSEASSKDAFADCMYTAMMVPHDKLYDRFRFMALSTAIDALFHQENYPPDYVLESLKLSRCFTEDEDGFVRETMMMVFIHLEKYREAIAVGNEIHALRKTDFNYNMAMSGAHSELKDFDAALRWFQRGIAVTPPDMDVTTLRVDPAFVTLREARSKEFFETLQPRFSWNYTLGFAYDEFTMTNNNSFPLHDVSLKVSLTGRDWLDVNQTSWDRTFHADYIAPGQTVKWDTSRGGHSLVRYRAKGSATMQCRQDGKRMYYGPSPAPR